MSLGPQGGRALPDGWHPLEVPDELRGVPGIERRIEEEIAVDESDPLKSWIEANAVTRKYLHDVAMPYVNKLFPEYRQRLLKEMDAFGTRSPSVPAAEADMTEAIRAFAIKELELTLVGFRPYQDRYTFVEERGNVHIRKNVIAIGLEQPYDETQAIPGREAEIATVRTYAALSERALRLAQFLLDSGYRAQPTIKTMLVQPYFVDAGLGQMGANGQMLSPHCGSRVRLMVVLTDAPMRYDEPVDYGIPRLCEECQVCVQRCPGRALGRKLIWWRGVRKFKTTDTRCVPMLVKYDNCGVCMKVCPVQKYGYNAVMDHYRETGKILGKGTDDLEGYDLPDRGHFGPAQLPKFDRSELMMPTLDERPK